MDREERRRFSACADKYARARSWLLCHDAGRSSFFTCAEALQECPKDLTPHLPTAYKFLAAHGRINFGLAPKPDQDQAQVPTPIVATDNDVPPDPVTPPNSLDQLVKELYAILRKVDWQVTTEKSIRKMLEEALGYSVQEHKALIKHHVNYAIAHQEQQATLQPPAEEKATEAKAPALPAAAAPAAADAAAAGEAKKASRRQRLARVLVVGASAAGLAAASTLQACGVEVVVLEAQQWPGGRWAAPQLGTHTALLHPGPLLPSPPPASLPGTQPGPQAPAAEGSVAAGAESWAAPGLHLLQRLAQRQGVQLPPGGAGGGLGRGQQRLRVQVVMDPATGSEVESEVLRDVSQLLKQVVDEAVLQSQHSPGERPAGQAEPSLGAVLSQLLQKHLAAAVPAAVPEASLDGTAPAAGDSAAAAGDSAATHANGSTAAAAATAAAGVGKVKQSGRFVLDERGQRCLHWLLAAASSQLSQPVHQAPLAAASKLQQLLADLTACPSHSCPAGAAAAAGGAAAAAGGAAAAAGGAAAAAGGAAAAAGGAAAAAGGAAAAAGGAAGAAAAAAAGTQLWMPATAAHPTTPSLLLQGLAQGLKIHYGCKVSSVAHGKHGVKLVTAAGMEFEGGLALLAIPPSALLPQGGPVFDPSLPVWKEEVLARMAASSTARMAVLAPWPGQAPRPPLAPPAPQPASLPDAQPQLLPGKQADEGVAGSHAGSPSPPGPPPPHPLMAGVLPAALDPATSAHASRAWCWALEGVTLFPPQQRIAPGQGGSSSSGGGGAGGGAASQQPVGEAGCGGVGEASGASGEAGAGRASAGPVPACLLHCLGQGLQGDTQGGWHPSAAGGLEGVGAGAAPGSLLSEQQLLASARDALALVALGSSCSGGGGRGGGRVGQGGAPDVKVEHGSNGGPVVAVKPELDTKDLGRLQQGGTALPAATPGDQGGQGGPGSESSGAAQPAATSSLDSLKATASVAAPVPAVLLGQGGEGGVGQGAVVCWLDCGTLVGGQVGERDLQVAAAPVKNALLFTGEHTSPPELLGSLAGELLAGCREAARAVLLLEEPGCEQPEVCDEAPLDYTQLKAEAKARLKALSKAAKRKKGADDEVGASLGDKGKDKAKKSRKGGKKEGEEQDKAEVKDSKPRKDVKKGKAKGKEEGEGEGKEKKGKAKTSRTVGKKSKRDEEEEEGEEEEEEEEEGEGTASGSSGEEDGSGSAGEGAQPPHKAPEPKVKAAKAKEEKAPAFDREAYLRLQQQLESTRQDLKTAYKAVMQAASGRLEPLRAAVAACSSNLDYRQQLLHVLGGSSGATLEAIANDAALFKAIITWLEEQLDRGAALEHLSLACLRLLLKLPAPPEVIRASGGIALIKAKGLTHFAAEVKAAAGLVWAAWAKKCKPAALPSPSLSPSLPHGPSPRGSRPPPPPNHLAMPTPLSCPPPPGGPPGMPPGGLIDPLAALTSTPGSSHGSGLRRPPLPPSSLPPSLPQLTEAASQPGMGPEAATAPQQEELRRSQAPGGAAGEGEGPGGAARGPAVPSSPGVLGSEGGTRTPPGPPGAAAGGTHSNGDGGTASSQVVSERLQMYEAAEAQLRLEREMLDHQLRNRATTPAPQAVVLPTIPSFDDYRRQGSARRQYPTSSRPADPPRAPTSAAAAPSALSSSTTGIAGLTGSEWLKGYVGALLKEAIKEGRLAKDRFHAIRDKVVAKVTQAGGVVEGEPPSAKVKDKVKALVAAYVEAKGAAKH